jgi:methylated-DNA-protein-cysteine methyltransferase-like protein
MLAELLRYVRKIPRGRVATYGAVARAAGYDGAARQVAWALHNCPPDVPWQRVVGSKGRILLRGAAALEQRLRLEQEGVRFAGPRIDMAAHEHHFAPVRVRAKPRK